LPAGRHETRMAVSGAEHIGETADGVEAPALTDGFHLVIDALRLNGIDTIYGVPGIPITDLGRLAHPLSWLHHAHLAPPALRVRARPPVPDYLLAPDAVDPACARAGVPALIKSYLRLGGRIGDGIFVDHAFRTTDVCILLDTARMSRHAEALAARVGPAA